MLTNDISINTNATDNDINQLNDVYCLDIDNNYNETNHDDYVIFSEDSLVASTESTLNFKNVIKRDMNMHTYLDSNLQVN
jgi:hypothetical protein